MGIGYQTHDRHAFDYQMWALPDMAELLRGPRRWTGRRPFLSFLGAAQTFGRFVARPFPEIVSGALGVDHLNLGAAGAGPEHYLNKPAMMNYINRGSLCVMQVMSGRSISTSLLESVGGRGMLKFRTGPRAGQRFIAADAYRLLAAEYGAEATAQQRVEARERWIACYRELIANVTVPKVLLWMSTRSLDTPSDLDSQGGLGEFPQLIARPEVEELLTESLTFVEAVVKEPTYMRVVDSVTGEPAYPFSKEAFPRHLDWTRDLNKYYYVQRQHDEAAAAIIAATYAKQNTALREAIRTALA
jgi:hypothetical protein